MAEHIASALLHRHGVHGEVLACVLAHGHGDWEQTPCGTLSDRQIRDCDLSALRWAGDASRQLISE